MVIVDAPVSEAVWMTRMVFIHSEIEEFALEILWFTELAVEAARSTRNTSSLLSSSSGLVLVFNSIQFAPKAFISGVAYKSVQLDEFDELTSTASEEL